MRTGIRKYLVALFALAVICMLTSIPATAATHQTIYKNQNYSRVYDYDYYTTHTHPELAGKDDAYVLKYFVTNGIKKREQACSAFNVTWFYNANPTLRYSYGTKWAKYYLYYQKKGYKKGSVSVCTNLQQPINYYKIGSKKISLKKIYDFEYFTKNNPAAYKYWKNQDDAGAVKYFVKTGMLAGMQGNAKKTKDDYAYRLLMYKIFPTMVDNEYAVAHVYKSETKYLILVNEKKHMVYVFEGKKHNWKKIRQFPCCVGAKGTETTIGMHKLFLKRYYFNTGGCRCFWFSLFKGDQGFHSILYNKDSEAPSDYNIVDGTMGASVSHGCVRVPTADAKWIYDNIPLKTRVKVYNSPFK